MNIGGNFAASGLMAISRESPVSSRSATRPATGRKTWGPDFACWRNTFTGDSPAFTTLDGFEGSALAKYQTAGSPLLSGYLLGEKYLYGMAAALDVKHGAGHVVLIGFRPQWRGQPMGTFRIVFNAALYGREVAARARPNPMFWKAPAISDKKAP